MTPAAPGEGTRDARRQQLTGERITVALIPKAGEDLQRLQECRGMSKTDIVNRAITLYEFFEAQMRNGRNLIVQDPESGETQIVKFL